MTDDQITQAAVTKARELTATALEQYRQLEIEVGLSEVTPSDAARFFDAIRSDLFFRLNQIDSRIP